MTTKPNAKYFLILLGLIAVYIVIRWIMANSPFLAESYYDEAVTGEMALHILKGEHQLFFWGQPYMGALEAYLTSILFFIIGPSTLALHFVDVFICASILLLSYKTGALLGGKVVGILAAAYWAFCPLYLSIIGLLATGGHEEACAAGAFVLFGICWLTFRPSKNLPALVFLIGLLSGLGWWSSLIIAPFLLAGALGLSLARPRLLLSRIPWIGLAGFFLGSLPFWLWQFLHQFSTFHFFFGGEQKVPLKLVSDLYEVLRFSLFQSFLGDWWDGHSVLPAVPSLLAWIVFILIYLPALILTLLVLLRWFMRLATLQNPFQKPLDLVVFTFFTLIFSFAVGEPGTHSSLRYSLALYIPFTLILALWLGKVFRFRWQIGLSVVTGLLVFNLLLHYLFLNEFKGQPYRPIDGLIKALKEQGIRYAYADDRISQVLTFESGEKIICADYFGQRNFNYLRAVDAAPAGEVAIVTHRRLGRPYPQTMGAALRLLGGSWKRKEVGPFVFWYDFKEPDIPLVPLSPKDWQVKASRGEGETDLLIDRDILTSWKIIKRAGDFLDIDLGRARAVARISLLPGPFSFGLPSGFKVELSLDKKNWEKVAELMPNDMLGGLYWHGGHPRLDPNPRFQISFPPHPARYLRLTNLYDPATPEERNDPWTLAELFIYEAANAPLKSSPQSREAYNKAVRALDHWMDDPTGPHPLFPHVSLTVRQRQVDWQGVVQSVQEAIRETPDWEEPHQLLEEAVDWGELWNKGGKQRRKKTLDVAALFQEKNVMKIPSSRVTISASSNTAEAGRAIDGDLFSRWTSSKGQEPGMYVQVDLGTNIQVQGFSVFYGSSLNDYPRSLKILGSADGRQWSAISASSKSRYAFAENQIYKKTYYSFSPVVLRYLKLVQGGWDPNFWWSIYELEVYKKG